MKTTTIATALLALSLLVSQAANGPEITLDGPYDTDNTNEVLFVAHTIQLSNNVLKIEQSINSLFTWSVSATWSCYPYEQRVAGFFITPRNADDRFYRAVNTPCGPFTPAGQLEVAGLSQPIFGRAARWHTPDGYRPYNELPPSADGKVRRFILSKPPETRKLPPAPWQAKVKQPPSPSKRASISKLRSPKDS